MSVLSKWRRSALAISLCAVLAACETIPSTKATHNAEKQDRSYCEVRPEVCVLVGAVIVGGVIAIAANTGGDNKNSTGGGPVISDKSLKTDVRFVERLENGINLYAFRYKGDDRFFVGVDAAEIRADPRHAHAVVHLGNGFLAVDYDALGLKVVNEKEMRAAGRAAIARAMRS